MIEGKVEIKKESINMKKVLMMILAMVLVLGTVACGNTEAETEPATVGAALAQEFEANADGSVQEVAEKIVAHEMIPFETMVYPVEPGLLMGFDNAEITGFEEGVVFAPMMSTIPFVGYVFEVADEAEVDAFIQTLSDNANLRWNICTEAEEMTVTSSGTKVFFLMSPMDFEEAAE